MYTTYHLTSAQELNTDILDAIKTTYKSKAITITVEEDDEVFEISNEIKHELEDRVNEEKSNYLSSNDSIKALKKKYEL